MYRIITILAFTFINGSIFAQSSRDFTFYNNESYQMYESANWKELIPLAKEAIDQGHDFYYMRMRLGIAYYERSNYASAMKQFSKALEFYPESPDAKAYAHYCLVFLGRIQEANAFYPIDSVKPKFVRSIYFEPGIKFSDGSAFTGDVRYFFVGLGHELGRKLSLFHGYQRLSADFITILEIANGQGQGNGTTEVEYAYTVTQNEYYLAPAFLIIKGLYFEPAYHFQDVRTTGYQTSNHVVGFRIGKWWSRIRTYGGYYYSQINTLSQNQFEAGITYYPLGNSKLYLQAQGTAHIENSRENLIGLGTLGIKMFSNTWVEGKLSVGDMLNYSESNGYLVYNQLDMLKAKWGITLHQYLGKHRLLINYTQEHKEEYATGDPFVHHSIVLGLNLSF